MDILKKAIGLALKELKRVKEKSEIGKGSTLVWGLDEVENEINSPCHWGGGGRFSDKQYLPFFHQIVFHIQEVIASVPVNDELRLE